MLQRASLLVFDVQLACIGKKGIFSRVLMNLDFVDMPGAMSAKTTILARAPFEFEEKLEEKDIMIKQTKGIKSSVSAQINIAGGKGGVERTTTNDNLTMAR